VSSAERPDRLTGGSVGSAPVTDGSRKAIFAAFFANLGIAASLEPDRFHADSST
jgi:hypothetical protein